MDLLHQARPRVQDRNARVRARHYAAADTAKRVRRGSTPEPPPDVAAMLAREEAGEAEPDPFDPLTEPPADWWPPEPIDWDPEIGPPYAVALPVPPLTRAEKAERV